METTHANDGALVTSARKEDIVAMTSACARICPPRGKAAVPEFAAPAIIARSARNVVRPLEEGDLDSVARLFLSRFRSRRAAADARGRAEVVSYMRQLYLEGPARRAGVDSQVQINARGKIGAFVGVIRATYLLDGNPLTAGINGVLMASGQEGDSLAAVQLLRELHRGPLDLIFTDSANRTSMALGRAMKYKIMSPESLEWACVFDPAAILLHRGRQLWPWAPTSLLRPFARAADFAVKRALRSRMKRTPPAGWSDEAINVSRFVEMAPRFLEEFRLRPEWTPGDLGWLVGQAALRQSAGPLNFHVIRNASRAPVGCYAFYGEKGGVARVIHAAATNKGWSGLLPLILDNVESMGCIGVHGAAREGMTPYVYSTPGLFFYYTGGTMVYSNRADVLSAVEDRGAFIGGFAGDRWTRLATDDF